MSTFALLGAPIAIALLLDSLRPHVSQRVIDVRGRGLLVGIELDRPARPVCEQLLARGILCKDTHERVIRVAPPLVIDEADLRWMASELCAVLQEI